MLYIINIEFLESIILWLCKNMSAFRRYQLKHLGVKHHDVCNVLSNGSITTVIKIGRGRKREGGRWEGKRSSTAWIPAITLEYTLCSMTFYVYHVVCLLESTWCTDTQHFPQPLQAPVMFCLGWYASDLNWANFHLWRTPQDVIKELQAGNKIVISVSRRWGHSANTKNNKAKVLNVNNLGESRWQVYGWSLHYSCNFSLFFPKKKVKHKKQTNKKTFGHTKTLLWGNWAISEKQNLNSQALLSLPLHNPYQIKFNTIKKKVLNSKINIFVKLSPTCKWICSKSPFVSQLSRMWFDFHNYK